MDGVPRPDYDSGVSEQPRTYLSHWGLPASSVLMVWDRGNNNTLWKVGDFRPRAVLGVT